MDKLWGRIVSWLFGEEKEFGGAMNSHPYKTGSKVIGVLFLACIVVFSGSFFINAGGIVAQFVTGTILPQTEQKVVASDIGQPTPIPTSTTSIPTPFPTSSISLGENSDFVYMLPPPEPNTPHPQIHVFSTEPSKMGGDGFYHTEVFFGVAVIPETGKAEITNVVPKTEGLSCGELNYASSGLVMAGRLLGRITFLYKAQCTSLKNLWENPVNFEIHYRFGQVIITPLWNWIHWNKIIPVLVIVFVVIYALPIGEKNKHKNTRGKDLV